MQTVDNLGLYTTRISELCPDLVIETVRLNRDGLLNDVVVVNGELVFRFAKTGFGASDLLQEANVLRLLRKYITLPIPTPFYESHEVMGYRLIPGACLRRDILMRWAEDD